MSNKDVYFLKIAKQVGQASKCLSRKIGSVLVKNGTIISTGYNGPARKVKHCGQRGLDFFKKIETKFAREYTVNVAFDNKTTCPRKILGYGSGQGLHLCQAAHSERNAILQAARNGISTLGATLYCACPLPCLNCSIEIIQAGVREVVCFEGEDHDLYSRVILQEAEIVVRQINEKTI